MLRAALSTLDRLAVASMAPVLQRANKPVPRVLVYQDKGTGASILRAGVRLWAPGAVMPVAAIKIVRHNLYRPTSLFHETGHQVAHLTGWTPSVRDALARALAGDAELQAMWTPWASEIAADVYAFLHTGYASVAALYDVVGDARDDPALADRRSASHRLAAHRAGLRVLAQCFGATGPWDAPAARDGGAAIRRRPPTTTLQPLLARSMAAMPRIAAACLSAPVPALRRQADDRRARSAARVARCARGTRTQRPARRCGLRRTGARAKASGSSRSPACARPSVPRPRRSGSTGRARG